ncbi:MAG: hypothetical protein ACE5SW_07840 [Nitrososphaeraceae archaeon]
MAHKFVFLFGAGISIPANLPDMKKMTEEFYTQIDWEVVIHHEKKK